MSVTNKSKQKIYDVLVHQRNYEQAIYLLQKVYSSEAKDEFYWVNLAVALQKLGRFSECQKVCDIGLNHFPQSSALNINASHSHISELKERANEEAIMEKLRFVSDENENAYILARLFYMRGEYQKSYDILSSIEVVNARYLNLQGENLTELLQHDEALIKFQEAIKIDPKLISANWNLSLAEIRNGNDEGWLRYHYGFKMVTNGRGSYIFDENKIIKNSSDLDEPVVFWGEQGIGDCIFFAQVLPQTRVKHKIAVVERLIPVLKRLVEPNYEVIDISSIQDFNVPNLPLGSLPSFMLETEGKIEPRPRFKTRNCKRKGPKRIGICWRGGTTKKAQLKRSVPLGLFKRCALELHEHEFVLLQYNPDERELAYLKKHIERIVVPVYDPVQDLHEWVNDILNCDALVSVDNSAVHFAGAFGIPTLMLTNELADFRWGLSSQNKWYPSVHNDIGTITELDERANRICSFINEL